MAERTVQFWHVTDPFHEQLAGVFPANKVIDKIQAAAGEERYVETSDGVRLLGAVLREKAPQHISLSRIRRDNLPSLERNGSLDDLHLSKDQNLAEPTHFCFFQRNVVGMLYNHDGPRASRLAGYLDKTLGIQVSLAPVLDSNTAKRLDQMGFITSVEIGLPVARAHLLDSATTDVADIPRSFREMADASRAKTLNVRIVIWGAGEAGAEPKWRTFLQWVTRSPALGAFTKLAVHSRGTQSAAAQTVDFVKEQLAMTENVDLRGSNSRMVTDASAQKAIRDAYDRLKSEIRSSVPPIDNIVLTLESLAPPH